MHVRRLKQFLELELASAVLLFLMATLAMIWENSPLAYLRQQFIDVFLFWINEGLMAVFFLAVGLELKRGYLEGQLSHWSQVTLPLCAAFGGMLIPALVYIGINYANPETLRGWATPVATDIAFAVGVLSLFGRHIPRGLKLFLLALAIFDDIGAIVIILFFYSHGLSLLWIFLACAMLIILIALNALSVKSLYFYIIIGCLLWFCLLHSGIHPTIAGVLLALTIPDDQANSPLQRLENFLNPWVSFFIMPLFALANAGVSLQGLSTSILFDVIVLGIILGLFFGKQIGVLGFSWLVVKLGWAKLPDKTTWPMLYGVALLCGIGFTMSLFLGTLSFQNKNIYLAEVRLGVIIGSILSGLAGAIVLAVTIARKMKLRPRHAN